MKCLVVMDSFKGSVSSVQAGEAVKSGIEAINKSINVEVVPFADGGEGTLEAILGDNPRVTCSITFPDGREGISEYGIRSDGTAVIESAKAVGLNLIALDKHDPFVLSSYGLGQLVLDAYSRGVRKFIVSLGGSGTNDGGVGMLSALGVKFYDEMGKVVSTLDELRGLASIEIPDDVSMMLNSCEFTAASDVTNPLCGQQGASRVFGPQKGLIESRIQEADEILHGYALLADLINGTNCVDAAGAGAAGGLGFALLSFMKAKLVSGAQAVISANDIENKIKNADLVITGEGKVDQQTLMGKGIGIIKDLASKYNKQLLILCGKLEDADWLADNGIKAVSVDPGGMPLEELMKIDVAKTNLTSAAYREIKLIYDSTR